MNYNYIIIGLIIILILCLTHYLKTNDEGFIDNILDNKMNNITENVKKLKERDYSIELINKRLDNIINKLDLMESKVYDTDGYMR